MASANMLVLLVIIALRGASSVLAAPADPRAELVRTMRCAHQGRIMGDCDLNHDMKAVGGQRIDATVWIVSHDGVEAGGRCPFTALPIKVCRVADPHATPLLHPLPAVQSNGRVCQGLQEQVKDSWMLSTPGDRVLQCT